MDFIFCFLLFFNYLYFIKNSGEKKKSEKHCEVVVTLLAETTAKPTRHPSGFGLKLAK